MKRRIEILLSVLVLTFLALMLFAPPWITAILGLLGLAIACISYARDHGISRAVIMFFKELLFGW